MCNETSSVWIFSHEMNVFCKVGFHERVLVFGAVVVSSLHLLSKTVLFSVFAGSWNDRRQKSRQRTTGSLQQ